MLMEMVLLTMKVGLTEINSHSRLLVASGYSFKVFIAFYCRLSKSLFCKYLEMIFLL